MKKVAYFTNIAPHYREKLWLAFAQNLGVEMHYFYGYSSNQSIESIDFSSEEWKGMQHQVHEIDNIKFKRRLVFQKKVLRHILFKKWDCIILLGDANLISNWILSIVAKIKGIPVIFWGHGIYGNESGLKKALRKRFYSIADLNLVYGHWAKQQMIKEGFKEEKINVIYNSVNYEESKALRQTSVDPDVYKTYFKNDSPVLVFIGRLTKVKKIDLLIQAVSDLKNKGFNVNLMIIGTGECREDLEKLARDYDISAVFYGACYEEKKISKLIANADLCVSPGNVGLTSIHSMSYGTPVCTNNDFKNQMPEFEAIKEGSTGCFFDKEKGDLAETISNWFKNSSPRELVRKNCYKIVDEYYNPDHQTRIMREAINKMVEH